MAWHIFKKDLKLLWRLVVAVAAVQFISAAVRLRLGLFGENPMLERLSDLLLVIAFLGVGFLIAAIVHQDPIPGVRQDWLVRPVERRDLLFAKVLFVLVMVQGPILAADLFQGLANGFPFGQSLAAAVSRSIYLLVAFSLPVLGFASLTRTMTEAIVVGVVVFFGFFLFQMLAFALHPLGTGQFRQIDFTSVGWVTESARFALVLLGAGAVLGLQYFRRKTRPALVLAVGVLVLCLLTQFVPWQPVFAIQQRLSPHPGAGNLIAMTFDPGAGRFQRPTGLNAADEMMRQRVRGDESNTSVHVPLHLTGLPNDTVLEADRAAVRLTGPGGKTKYFGPGDDLEVRKEGSSDGEARTYQEIDIPDKIYNRIKGQPARLEIDYSLTALRLESAYAIPAVGGDQRMPGVGWCETQMNESGTAVELHCMKPGKGLSCGSVFLEDGQSGKRNPERSACSPDYSPYSGQYAPDDMSRFAVNLSFRDAAGLAQYPVGSSQIAGARVVLRAYGAEDHFTRMLVVPQITLKDWEAR